MGLFDRVKKSFTQTSFTMKDVNNSNISINGDLVAGKNISVVNGKLFIDGKEIDKDILKELNITIIGDVEKLDVTYCNSLKINGNCFKVETVMGDVSIEGSVENVQSTSGDIVVSGNIKGNAKTTSGDIKADTIYGSANTVSGDVKYKAK